MYTINQVKHPWQEALTLEQLLIQQKKNTLLFPHDRIFFHIVVNRKIIPKDHYCNHVIRDGDAVLILPIVSGG